MLARNDHLRRGNFWSSVDIAHEGGQFGQGKKIAVLDSGFDLSQLLLQNASVNSSTHSRIDPAAAHGTAVAMILATVAPQAELVLKDVGRGGPPSFEFAAESLDEAKREDVDVICMSFGNKLPRYRLEPGDLEISSLFESGGDPWTLRSILREYILAGGFKGHMRGGCPGGGVICDALSRLSQGKSLVVAAAGNDVDLVSCPAVHESVLAVASHLYSSRLVDEDRILESTDIESLSQSLFADLTIDKVPGFDGTSFAAPLVAGFSALLENPKEMREGALTYQATQVAKQRHANLCFPPVATNTREEPFIGVASLYEEVISHFHPAHRHQHPAVLEPCAYCSLLHHDFWQMFGLLIYGAGDFESARLVLERGAQLAPRAAGLISNLAATLHRSADTATSQKLKRELLLRASSLWLDADRYSYDEPGHLQFSEAARREALSIDEDS
jgi:hypothetical protein